jgi:hypothetical protein
VLSQLDDNTLYARDQVKYLIAVFIEVTDYIRERESPGAKKDGRAAKGTIGDHS